MRRTALLIPVLAIALFCGMTWPDSARAAPGQWSRTGNLVESRESHAAVRLLDGRVLVVGGIRGGSFVASAEFFDPATGRWTATRAMSVARGEPAAALLGDGRVLVVGGCCDGNRTAEIWDPVTELWTPAGGPTGPQSGGHTLTLLQDGRVLLVGGGSPRTRDIFDPATGAWTQTRITSPVFRHYHTATLLPDGRVLIAGGFSDAGTSAELYDPLLDEWTETGTLFEGRDKHIAALLPDGRVLVAGGERGTARKLQSAETYDPTTGLWSRAPQMAVTRASFGAATLPDGRILVAGAGIIDTESESQRRSAEIYDPITGTWTATGSMFDGRYDHTVTALLDGRVLVTAGDSIQSRPADKAEMYEP